MITDSAPAFLSKITSLLQDNCVDIKNWEIDHLCYRTDSQEHYANTKIEFQKIARLLIESEVGGRLIATYKLHEPIVFKEYFIDLIEVPAPKIGRTSQRGFEHIEVVINCSFKELINANQSIKFKKKGLSKLINPELEIEFEDCAVKFHHKSLEHIINIENNDKIMSFLSSSRILEKLKNYSPLISGSYPLGIETEESDLDILFTAESFDTFEKEVRDKFSSYSHLNVNKKRYQNIDVLVINFDYKSLEIELFCSSICVYQQQANTHLLVEGRVLKLAGNVFTQSILDLKERGIKTEPAFGKLLSLTSPYEDLVNLSKMSDKELFAHLQLGQLKD